MLFLFINQKNEQLTILSSNISPDGGLSPKTISFWNDHNTVPIIAFKTNHLDNRNRRGMSSIQPKMSTNLYLAGVTKSTHLDTLCEVVDVTSQDQWTWSNAYSLFEQRGQSHKFTSTFFQLKFPLIRRRSNKTHLTRMLIFHFKCQAW